MMKDTRGLHAKLQEYIDCYLEAQPRETLREISEKGVGGDRTGDVTELSLRYLASALILGIEEEARLLTILREGVSEGGVTLKGDGEVSLPVPPAGVCARMIEILRGLTGIEGPDGEGKLSCGFRRHRVVLNAAVGAEEDREKFVIGLPGIQGGGET